MSKSSLIKNEPNKLQELLDYVNGKCYKGDVLDIVRLFIAPTKMSQVHIIISTINSFFVYSPTNHFEE